VPGTTFPTHMGVVDNLLNEDNEWLNEILFTQLSLKQIEHITNRLEYLKHIIRKKDHDVANTFIKQFRNDPGTCQRDGSNPSKLEELRCEIRKIDIQCAELLYERFEIAKKIGTLKEEQGLPVRNEDMESQVLQTVEQFFARKDQDPEIAKELWLKILEYSRKIQNK